MKCGSVQWVAATEKAAKIVAKAILGRDQRFPYLKKSYGTGNFLSDIARFSHDWLSWLYYIRGKNENKYKGAFNQTVARVSIKKRYPALLVGIPLQHAALIAYI